MRRDIEDVEEGEGGGEGGGGQEAAKKLTSRGDDDQIINSTRVTNASFYRVKVRLGAAPATVNRTMAISGYLTPPPPPRSSHPI